MRVQVYTFIMQELVKYRGMYTSMAEALKSGTPGPDLHAHHDLLASALPPGSAGQAWRLCPPKSIAVMSCHPPCFICGTPFHQSAHCSGGAWPGPWIYLSSCPVSAPCEVRTLVSWQTFNIVG